MYISTEPRLPPRFPMLALLSHASLANSPWTLVLQYGDSDSGYPTTSDASGVVDPSTTGFAKLSDAAIVAMSDDDGDSTYDYYRITCDARDTGWGDDITQIFVRVPNGVFQDTERAFGWTLTNSSYSTCLLDDFGDCWWPENTRCPGDNTNEYYAYRFDTYACADTNGPFGIQTGPTQPTRWFADSHGTQCTRRLPGGPRLVPS